MVVSALLGLGAIGCPDETDQDDAGLVDAALDAGDGRPTGDLDTGDTTADGTSMDGQADTVSRDGDAVGVDGGEVGDAAMPDGGQSDGGGQPPCMSDQMCPGNAVCEEGDCRFYRFVQIADVTRDKSSSATEACGGETAGADLFQLELRGPFGGVIGYARTVDSAVTAETHTDAEGVFDGVGNSLRRTDDDNLCPSGGFGPNTTLSLGCNGVLVVAFTDGAGNIVNLATGQQLVIHEYGNQCCEGGCPEEYWEVRVCNSERRDGLPEGERDEEGNFPSCATRVVETGKGYQQITLQLPR